MSDLRIGPVRTVSITDADEPADVARRRRERRYALLMVVHLIGLTVGGLLYSSAFWAGLALIVVTGPLPWVAVVMANDGPPRRRRTAPPGPRRTGPPELDSGSGPSASPS